MAVKLRLRRMGKKKQPIYKMVAADSRSPRDGKFLEAVGFYNPLTNPHTLDLKEDRIMYWLNVGAQPTNTVKSLLRPANKKRGPQSAFVDRAFASFHAAVPPPAIRPVVTEINDDSIAGDL